MRRVFLIACFAVLAIAAFAAEKGPGRTADPTEVNGVTPTPTQPPPTGTPPTPTQPPGPTPSPPPG